MADIEFIKEMRKYLDLGKSNSFTKSTLEISEVERLVVICESALKVSITQTIEIKPGVWCDDIPNESEFDKFYSALVVLNIGFHGGVSYSEYLVYKNVGIEVEGRAYHATLPSYFTTQVSYKDIIAAANAMEV